MQACPWWIYDGNKRLGADAISAPWCARSFKSIHTQRISVALHLAAAEEIMDTILLDGASAAQQQSGSA